MIEPYDIEVEQHLTDEANRRNAALPEELCLECDHPVRLHHAKYGCEYERGDSWVTGNQADAPTCLMAMGPCGCKAVDPLQQLLAQEHARQEEILRRSDASQRQSYTPTEVAGPPPRADCQEL